MTVIYNIRNVWPLRQSPALRVRHGVVYQNEPDNNNLREQDRPKLTAMDFVNLFRTSAKLVTQWHTILSDERLSRADKDAILTQMGQYADACHNTCAEILLMTGRKNEMV